MFRLIVLLLHLLFHGCWSNRPSPNKLVTIETICTRDLLQINVNMEKSFKGIVFAKDFVDDCRSKGNNTSKIELRLSTAGCGVRSEPKFQDNSMELSVKILIQMDEKLQQSSDIEKIVRCKLSTDIMTMNVLTTSQETPTTTTTPIEVVIDGDNKKNIRYGRMRHGSTNNLNKKTTTDGVSIKASTTTTTVTTPSSPPSSPPRIRVWLELGGLNGAGAVEVGQLTTLGIRAVLPGTIGVRIIDCLALDGLGESSQNLLDERGCSVDEQVMPALLTRLRTIEEGWSKPHHDDLVEKLFITSFPAFKFPDRERLHVSCSVQLCKGNCPEVDCKNNVPFELNADQQLARIEVFNSLAVTAPQIELDRLQLDRRFNVTVDEYPMKIKHIYSEGTLCLSTSKLALSFCALGLIFLMAVIVSICCLLRAKARHTKDDHHHLHGPILTGTTSIFSSSSSSQSRFGSRLLLPYGMSGNGGGGGGGGPYGRVY